MRLQPQTVQTVWALILWCWKTNSYINILLNGNSDIFKPWHLQILLCKKMTNNYNRFGIGATDCLSQRPWSSGETSEHQRTSIKSFNHWQLCDKFPTERDLYVWVRNLNCCAYRLSPVVDLLLNIELNMFQSNMAARMGYCVHLFMNEKRNSWNWAMGTFIGSHKTGWEKKMKKSGKCLNKF